MPHKAFPNLFQDKRALELMEKSDYDFSNGEAAKEPDEPLRRTGDSDAAERPGRRGDGLPRRAIPKLPLSTWVVARLSQKRAATMASIASTIWIFQTSLP